MFLRFFYELLDTVRHPIPSGFASAGRGVMRTEVCKIADKVIGGLEWKDFFCQERFCNYYFDARIIMKVNPQKQNLPEEVEGEGLSSCDAVGTD